MSRPAFLFSDPTSLTNYEEITVRYHARTGLVGDLAGTSLSYAENHDDEETMVFWREQLVPIYGGTGSPPRGVLVVLSSSEAYYVDNTRPFDGQTITAEVTRAGISDLVGRAAPADE